jgi:antibiotic biosynthesis monooxygenase (ABM) superfamily enzyme
MAVVDAAGRPNIASDAAGPVSIVTQTRAAAGQDATFLRWQDELGATIIRAPGFIDQKILPPNPPLQTDWVIVQHFLSSETAVAWLHSPERLKLIEAIQPILLGRDDVHLVKDSDSGVRPSPVSLVVSTQIKAGQEIAFRRWEQRIAGAQIRAAGFQGYRFDPPIPGVQDDWLAIVRFDSEVNLDRWMNSPERLQLLEEAKPFTETVRARAVRTGFDQWFPEGKAGLPPPTAWKQNMIVLLVLYPVVFLFGFWVQKPLLMDRIGIPFWLALFIGNAASVVILNWLVPWTSGRFLWWLQPNPSSGKKDVYGAGAVFALYAVLLLIFSRL